MADTLYRLFGEEYLESQQLMMTRVFRDVLSRHPEQITSALQSFSCLSAVDYNRNLAALQRASTLFVNRQTFRAAGIWICIGLAYDLEGKKTQIARLLDICREEPTQFELLDAPFYGRQRSDSPVEKSPNRLISYRLFGAEYCTNQREMLGNTLEGMLRRRPELIDWAVENLHCLSYADRKPPSRFRLGRMISIGDTVLCVSDGYNIKQKVDFIHALQEQAGLPEDCFVPEDGAAVPPLPPPLAEAIHAVTERLRDSGGKLGDISVPAGANGNAMVAELCREALPGGRSVLLVTESSRSGRALRDALDRMMAGSYPIVHPTATDDIMAWLRIPGTISVLSVHQLRRLRPSDPQPGLRQLLVISEADSAPELNHIFPDAAFLELSGAAAPSSLSTYLPRISDALAERRYAEAEAALEEFSAEAPEESEALKAQLRFLSPLDADPAAREAYHRRHAELLAWQSRLWNLLSRDSAFDWWTQASESPEPESPAPVSTAPVSAGRPSPAAQHLSPQQRGAQLEVLVLEFFTRLLGPDLDFARPECAGTQNGYDISLRFRDSDGSLVECRVECKNYQSTPVTLEKVTGKLDKLQRLGQKIDHWILIAPRGRLSNELSTAVNQWQELDRWYPVLNIQLWTAADRVDELFALVPELYERLFPGEQPPTLNAAQQAPVLARFRSRLAHINCLPSGWSSYLRAPERLLTHGEPYAEEYDALYRHHVSMRLLDENEMLIDGRAEAHILSWLRRPDQMCALLLGDFRDGKTFFTYLLARLLAEHLQSSPQSGWIPLRMSLAELGSCRDAYAFLDRRLREVCGETSSWNYVSSSYRILFLLDGLDEMSQSMDDGAVLDNLALLERLLRLFGNRHKILVTSRKMVLYSDEAFRRVLWTLNRPEVLHLAPLDREERRSYLRALAGTQERRERLDRLLRIRGLLELAEKPLFLHMMEAQLDRDSTVSTELSQIYEDYARAALERGELGRLALEGDHTHPGDLRDRMLWLLDELALLMLCKGRDSVTLAEFRAQLPDGSLASLLWDRPTCCAQEDAGNRITNRALLRYDPQEPDRRCFCHRSMREYFSARALTELLTRVGGGQRVQELLRVCSLGYEVLAFAGQRLRTAERGSRSLAEKRLIAFAHATKGQWEHCGSLGANSVNLLHIGGFGLPGFDWSGLMLDNALLSGASLARKDLSGSSLRYAHLDNADLTDCDLRRCDLTGVQFEKSGFLRCFAALPGEDALLAFYRDGTLRRWNLLNRATQSLGKYPKLKPGRLFLCGSGREAIAETDRIRFWLRSPTRLADSGGAALRQGLRMVDIGTDTVLVLRSGTLCLLELESGAVLWRRTVSVEMKAALLGDRCLVLCSWETGLELIDADHPAQSFFFPYPGPVTALSALSISRTEGIILLGDARNMLRSYRAVRVSTEAPWSLSPEAEADCGDTILGVAADELGGRCAAVASGSILRFLPDADGRLYPEPPYRLELRCTGARIEGVTPPEQRERLRQLIAEGI